MTSGSTIMGKLPGLVQGTLRWVFHDNYSISFTPVQSENNTVTPAESEGEHSADEQHVAAQVVPALPPPTLVKVVLMPLRFLVCLVFWARYRLRHDPLNGKTSTPEKKSARSRQNGKISPMVASATSNSGPLITMFSDLWAAISPFEQPIVRSVKRKHCEVEESDEEDDKWGTAVLLSADLPEDYDSEDDPDFVPGDNSDSSSDSFKDSDEDSEGLREEVESLKKGDLPVVSQEIDAGKEEAGQADSEAPSAPENEMKQEKESEPGNCNLAVTPESEVTHDADTQVDGTKAVDKLSPSKVSPHDEEGQKGKEDGAAEVV